MDAIRIRGARQHNLKNIDVDIPRGKLVVITGPTPAMNVKFDLVENLIFDGLLEIAKHRSDSR